MAVWQWLQSKVHNPGLGLLPRLYAGSMMQRWQSWRCIDEPYLYIMPNMPLNPDQSMNQFINNLVIHVCYLISGSKLRLYISAQLLLSRPMYMLLLPEVDIVFIRSSHFRSTVVLFYVHQHLRVILV